MVKEISGSWYYKIICIVRATKLIVTYAKCAITITMIASRKLPRNALHMMSMYVDVI